MSSFQPAPLPLPKPERKRTSVPKPAEETSLLSKLTAIGQSGSSGGRNQTDAPTVPPGKTTSDILAKWDDAQKNWVRLALMVPALALVLAVLGPDSVKETSIADFKIKAAMVREVLSVTTALLIVKLMRDASRILAIFRFSDLGLEFSSEARPVSNLDNTYVRPVDLLLGRREETTVSRTRALRLIERVRAIFL